MRVRCVRSATAVAVALVVLLTALAAPGMASPAPEPSAPVRTAAQDADGDFLDDLTDPDDDNDGVPDQYDADPLDPSVGTLPTPGPLSPDHDTDEDGIPNIQDPDSDQDGVADEDDPAPLDPVPTEAPPVVTEPEPAAPTPVPAPVLSPEPVRAAPPETDERPIVTAFPSTGDGPATASGTVGAIGLGAMALLLAIAGRRTRCRIGR